MDVLIRGTVLQEGLRISTRYSILQLKIFYRPRKKFHFLVIKNLNLDPDSPKSLDRRNQGICTRDIDTVFRLGTGTVRYLFERAWRGVEIHAPDEAWLLLAEYEQAGGRGGEQRTGAPVSGQLQPSLTRAAVVGGSSHRDTELNTDNNFN